MVVSITKFNDIASKMSHTFCEKYPKSEWSVSNTTEKMDLYKNKLFQCSFSRDGGLNLGLVHSLSNEEQRDAFKYRDIINNDLSLNSSKQDESDSKPEYYKDTNGKDLFYHLENGLMSYEMNKGFYTGNIFKYIFRHGKKDPEAEVEDLKKGRDYLNELIKITEEKIDNQ